MEWLNNVIEDTARLIDEIPKSERKSYGQFFTSESVARYMANLLNIPDTESLSVLDPGAGTGILSIALLERVEATDFQGSVTLVCYETDEAVIPTLEKNLETVKNECGFIFEYKILRENYIFAQAPEFENTLFCDERDEPYKFDLIIENPPYKKVPKASPEAQMVPSICKGAPNLYFIFAALSLFNLKTNGEMVIILPRSWTSGLYFKAFREYLFSNGSIEHMHLFVSRNKVFDKEAVLQETMILKIKKSIQNDSVVITTTEGSNEFDSITSFTAPSDVIISGPDRYVFLVTDQNDLDILEKLDRWKNTLPQLGLKMKTGLTVDFRTRSALRDEPDGDTVPLFYSQHLRNGKVQFPIGKEGEWIKTDKKGLHQPNENYLFVKRFTAKEEKRRFQCAVYLADDFPDCKTISTQNKINFISGDKPLDIDTVYGLYGIFTSTLYDKYYRILNGSTQVNSTEVNSMPVPPIEIIKKIGKELLHENNMSEATCNKVLERFICQN